MQKTREFMSTELRCDSGELIAATLRPLRALNIANRPDLTDLQLRQLLDRQPDLSTIELRNCPKLSDDSLYFLSEIKHNLHSLTWIGASSATNVGFATFFQRSENLSQINLSSTSCDPKIYSKLFFQKRLRALDLSFCPVTDETFREIRAPLEYLNLQGCSRITDETLYALGRLASLRHLFLAYNDRITPSGLQAIGSRCTLRFPPSCKMAST